jgi:AcrR family transcriptional regulator
MRTRILDTAEQLFSAQGFDAVSQRDVAEKAGIRLSLVTHHYASKRNLFDAVAGRRAVELNRRRYERLEAIGEPTVGKILDAFFLPLIDLVEHGGPGWVAYTRLISRLVYSDIGIAADGRYYKEIMRRYLAALEKVLAEVDKLSVARAFLNSVHVLLISLFIPGRLDELAEPKTARIMRRERATQVYAAVRPFLLGGFEAIRSRAAMGCHDAASARHNIPVTGIDIPRLPRRARQNR